MGPRRPEDLENTVLAATLPGFEDTWRTLRPAERGVTFDGARNPCVHDKAETMRYDRVMLRRGGWVPTSIQLLGTSIIPGLSLMPSDHYGLLLECALDHKAEVGGAESGISEFFGALKRNVFG